MRLGTESKKLSLFSRVNFTPFSPNLETIQIKVLSIVVRY